MGNISQAIELRGDGADRWLARADADHQSISGMFGGWTAAVTLGAVTRSAEPDVTPAALTMNFVDAIPADVDVAVSVEPLRPGRTVQHWRADVRTAEDGSLRATALVVLARRRPSDPHVQFAMPEAPEPSSLEMIHAPLPQGLQTDLRMVHGAYASGDTHSVHWMKDLGGRPLDHLLLAYLADQYAPRSFFWGPGFRPSATITMSVYFHATAEEIAAVGEDYILNEAVGTRGEASTSGQQARLWSRNGALLATTEQLAWYR
jgi:acyl-CoA thioesterase